MKIINAIKLITIITSMALLFGCSAPLPVMMDSSTKAFKPSGNAKKGLVYVYRESEFAASLRGMYISANGKRIGALNNGTYFAYEAAPGKLTLAAENSLNKPITREINIVAGKRYYIKGSFKMGFWDVIPNLTIMNSSEGQAIIQSLKYAKLVKK